MSDQLLLYAVSQGDIQQVSALIVEARANVNAVNSISITPSHIAAQHGLVSILELLLSYGSDPNICALESVGGQTPLHVAINRGYIKIVETLLNHYADPNIQDTQGFTPLHLAARKGEINIVHLLISKGANVEILDNQGKTAAYWAKEYKHIDICKLLPEFVYDLKAKALKELESVVHLEPDPKPVKKKKKGVKKKKKKRTSK